MKLYIVERATGEYDDFRTVPLVGTSDKKKAEKFAKDATEEAATIKEKHDKIWKPIWETDSDLVSNEEYEKAEKKTKRLKSKLDPDLDWQYFNGVSYGVVEVEEIK